ncbi:phage major capsid protein [Zavarzinella formosa]|uniref:phage major capsid protein n=1 Tax=Zavarzinella formosa TaxID=360055 RepID=UPI000315A6C1|nr:hypothetical protein [Zavarzinella formosa]
MPRPKQRKKSGLINAVARVAITGAEAPTAETPARFEMIAYTGEAMRIGYWSDPVVVDLETADLSLPMIPALYDHIPDSDYVVGQVQSLTIASKQLVAAGLFTIDENLPPERNYAKKVLAKAKAGYQWQASVGADPSTVEEIKAGAVGVANWGREYPGPCLIGRGCKFREMSFVVLGGDRRTSVVTARIKGTAMDFETWLTSLGFDADAQAAFTDIQRANLQQLYNDEFGEDADENTEEDGTEGTGTVADQVATTPPAQTTAAARPPAVRCSSRPAPTGGNRPNAVDAENRRLAANQIRVERIQQIAKDFPNVTVKAGNRQVSLAAHAIGQNWSANQTELYAIRAARPNPASSADAVPDRVQAQIVEAAVCITAGMKMARIAASFPAEVRERVMNEATSRQYRGFGIQALMDSTIRAAGRNYHGSRKTDDFVRAALESDRMIRGSAGFTTISLSGTLGNVANKALVASYEAQQVTWKEFCAVRSHVDFKPVSRFRLDMTGAFKKVGPDGELKHVGMTETQFNNQLSTYGAIMALTRQMQINDDLGAFLEIPTGLGRMSAVRIEEAAYVTMLSNPSSFFAAGNKNLNTGGGSALGVDGLTASTTAFQNQVDPNGKPILLAPDRILLPTTLGVLGQTLFKDTTLVTDGDQLAYYVNPHAGLYRPVVSPYLNNTAIRDQDGKAISGQSNTAWYQFADPSVRAAIAVAFLNGQEMPTIEDAETDFNTLGHQWRAYHDFGIGMEDPAAVQKNAGA